VAEPIRAVRLTVICRSEAETVAASEALLRPALGLTFDGMQFELTVAEAEVDCGCPDEAGAETPDAN
jgi:hypothetical protein